MENEQQQKNNPNQPPQKPGIPPKGPKFNLQWIYIAAFAGIMGLWFLGGPFTSQGREVSFQEFKASYLKKNLVKKLHVVNHQRVDVFLNADSLKSEKFAPLKKKVKGDTKGPQFHFSIGTVEQFKDDLNEVMESYPSIPKMEITYDNNEGAFLSSLLQFLLPLLIIVAIWIFLMRRMGGGGAGGPGGGLFSIGKSKAQLFDNKNTKVNVTFNDVAGLDEAKTEVMEIVDFLKQPKKYTALGGKIPKGVFLLALRVQVKHYWPKLWPVKRKYLSIV